MARWSALDERVAHLWYAELEWRREWRSLAYETARIMREVADTRRYLARLYNTQADRATGEAATHLRDRARHFDELATRAMRFAEKEEEEALRE